MMDLPWLQKTQQQFTDLLLRDQVPHALLIAGGKGLGKLQLAQKMAQMALCDKVSTAGACQSCPACLLYNAGNHTDFSHIYAEKSTIKVEQIRKLSQSVMLTSTRNKHKVILIQEAELMNKAAANALLKTLEEPPAKVLIILTTNEIGRLLPTIKSRCMKLSIAPPDFKQAFDWLSLNSKQSQQDREFSLMLNSSAPLMALAMLENNETAAIKMMLEDLMALTKGNKTVLDVSKDWISNEYHHFISAIAAYFLFLLKNDYNLSNDQSYFNNYMGSSDLFIGPKLLLFIKEIYLYNQRIISVLKSQLLLEELLIHWKNNFIFD